MDPYIPKKDRPILEELNTYLNEEIKPETTIANGFKFSPRFLPDTALYAKNEWDMPENVVYVVSYPKTGATWTMEILNQILYGKNQEIMQMVRDIQAPMLSLEMGTKKKFELLKYLPLPRILFATHLSEEWFNYKKVKEKKGKVIYVMRNPKDTSVSWFHFAPNWLSSDELGIEWNDHFSKTISGSYPMSVREGEWYPDHILGWMKHKDEANFLLLCYEDMKKNLNKEVERIADFLEVKLSPEEVTNVADTCTFNSLKKCMEDGLLFTERRKKIGLLRKGEVGGWKKYFTVTQSELMDKLIEEKLGHTGIRFTYEL